MANAIDLINRNVPAGTWGNVQYDEFDFTFANGDNIAATADIVILPPSVLPIDWYLEVSDAGPASTTLDIGLKSVNGTNQDDADLFFAVVAAAATGFTRRTINTPRFELAQPMYLRVTVQGANQNGSFAGKFCLFYRYRGNL